MKTIKILFLGDIFGEPGRKAVSHFVPRLKNERQLDLVLANCENAARGRGISKRIVHELLSFGIDFMTSGNHIFDVDDASALLNDPATKVIRPYNFSSNSPGRGVGIVGTRSGVRVGVINIMGRVFMEPGVNLPFDGFDQALADLQGDVDITVLDFHAEATSEKRAMGWYSNGKVQLCVGTHSHVQTADEEILPEGTGYITDLGMCGPHDSVIGMRKDLVIRKMRTALPYKFEIGERDIKLCGVICEIDVERKRAIRIERVRETMP